MNVDTIIITQDEAMQKLAAYRGLNAKQRNNEDRRLEQLYKAVSKGARVINIVEAFRSTGLNNLGQPKLAIASAAWKRCFFAPRSLRFRGTHNFWRERATTPGAAHYEIQLPSDTFDGKQQTAKQLGVDVPHIPPGIRPKIALSNFHILFEVEKWEEYPVDPFLLRHISGYLYVVLAEWDLTPLEASLLSSMRSGN